MSFNSRNLTARLQERDVCTVMDASEGFYLKNESWLRMEWPKPAYMLLDEGQFLKNLLSFITLLV